MGRRVDLDDLVDAVEVAAILGLSKPSAVSVYQVRYPDMPKPAIDRGGSRAKLWLRPEVEEWNRTRRAARD